MRSKLSLPMSATAGISTISKPNRRMPLTTVFTATGQSVAATRSVPAGITKPRMRRATPNFRRVEALISTLLCFATAASPCRFLVTKTSSMGGDREVDARKLVERSSTRSSSVGVWQPGLAGRSRLSCACDQASALHCRFFSEAIDIAEDRGHREHLAVVTIAYQAVARFDVALDVEIVPRLGMADVVDRHVVVLAPKERNLGKSLSLAENVARRRLTLPLGHDPMLDPQSLAGMGIGPARDVAGGKDSRHAGFKVFIHCDAAIDLETGALGQLDSRPHPNADDDEIGRQCRAAFEPDVGGVDRACRLLEMECDAVLLVDRAYEIAKFASEHAFQGPTLRCDDMNLDLARPQRGGNLEPDEARTDHDRALDRFCLGNDRSRIGERAQHVHVRLIGAGDIEANGFGAGCEQQLVEGAASTARKRYLSPLGMDPAYVAANLKVDRLFFINLGRSERHPLSRRVPRKIALRAIRPVIGRRLARREHRHAAGKSFPPQHLGRGESRRSATHDHHAFRPCARASSLAGGAFVGGLDLFAHERRAIALFHPPPPHPGGGRP